MENNNQKPLVTVVTVTINLIKEKREVYFRQCLESVHNQTYEDIEHIIIDGASTDGSLDLIKEYANKGWIKYISESDSGIYEAMNKGIKMAKGKYILFLNSDDFFHNSDGISISVDALENSGADFSFAPIKKLDIYNKPITYSHPPSLPDLSNVFFAMPICHQSMLAKREILIREGMFNTNYEIVGDRDLLLRLCLKNVKSVPVADTFVTFRQGGISYLDLEKNRREVSKVYFLNYNKITPISEHHCEKIYNTGYYNLPINLVNKLKDNNIYFDYNKYQKSMMISEILRRKFKSFKGAIRKLLKK